MVDFQERDDSREFGTDADDETHVDDEERGGETEERGHDDDHGDGDGDRNHDDNHGHDHDDNHDHDHHRHDVDQVGAAIVTVSSSRSLDTDPAGDAIEAAMETTGDVVTRELIPDDFDTVQGTVNRLTDRDDVDVIVTTGGTGVTPDDVTIEAVGPLFSKELPGFGELFRLLSHEEIGTKVVATRATAGVVEGVPVFCMPGSESAVRLGTEEIIVPEAGHLAGLASRGMEDRKDRETDEE